MDSTEHFLLRVLYGDVHTAKEILHTDHRVHVDSTLKEALMIASLRGDSIMVHYLLNLMAHDETTLTETHRKALIGAIQLGHVGVVAEMMQNPLVRTNIKPLILKVLYATTSVSGLRGRNIALLVLDGLSNNLDGVNQIIDLVTRGDMGSLSKLLEMKDISLEKEPFVLDGFLPDAIKRATTMGYDALLVGLVNEFGGSHPH